MNPILSRREMFRKASVGALLGTTFSKIGMASLAACGLTPKQTEGPFYPENDQADKDWDLTVTKGAAGPLLTNGIYGTPLYLSGVVQNEKCEPIEEALVEIWQACATGRYNHSGDTSGLLLDPNFQYWGRATTDARGTYLLKTILPGDYPASATWQRPPHIHVKVFARGHFDLTSQLYFLGSSFGGEAGALIDRLNQKDAILKSVPAAERSRVIIPFTKSEASPEPNVRLGKFDITLKKVQV